jgi:hypothetical protein
MASNLRRMVALGPAGTLYPGSSQDYRTYNNRAWTLDTRTRWVRLWADWPTLMPARGQWDSAHLSSLDAQIQRAKQDGLQIILTIFRFPTWANGTAAMTAAQLAATMPDRRTATQSDASAKTLLMRYPDDVSANSDWGQFVRALCSRYGRLSSGRPSKSTYVDWIELCNEPNLTWWPLQGPSPTANAYDQGPVIIQQVVARMMQTAQAISASFGGEPGIMAPATSDGDGPTRLKIGYDQFTDLLLAELAARRAKITSRMAWSHHNYTDVTYDQGPGSTAADAATNPARSVNRAAAVRSKLVGRWPGWPNGSASSPQVFLTEGGVTLKNIASRYSITDPAAQRTKQADLLKRNWARMGKDTGEGAGIAMLGQYLFYTDPNFDCGLCDTVEAGGAQRPAYAAWKALPSNI